MKEKNTLKRISDFWKKHHLPKKILVILLAILIIFKHIGKWFHRRRRWILGTIACVLVAVLSVFAIRLDSMSGKDEKNTGKNAYGNEKVTEEEEISEEILNQDEIERTLDWIKTENLVEQVKDTADSYYIRINRIQNCLTIYVQDENGEYTKPYKAMICSTGGVENTPTGVFNLGQRSEFEMLLFEVYGQYATNICGQILFHSISYSAMQKDAMIPTEFNNLGEGVSHGCIRLTTRDAKWIYENCLPGTVCEIYDDEDPGPLGKPEMLKVPMNTTWDPTDDCEENPWKDVTPEISGVEDREVKVDEAVDFLEGITAKDTCGNDVTDTIEVYGTVDVTKKGNYMVVYYVKDLIGRTDTRTAIYRVR